MTLEQATLAALEAAESGDLDALERALAARQVALDQDPASIDAGVHSAGELTAGLLREMIRSTRMESARLQRLADGFRSDAQPPAHINFVG